MNDDDTAIDAQRRELQRRIFSAASESADARAAVRQLHQLELRRLQRLNDDRATAERSAPAAAVATSAPDRPETDPAPPDAIASADRDSTPNRVAVVRIAAAVLLALVVGIAIGHVSAARPTPGAPTTDSRPIVDSSAALALFDRPQTSSDVPAQALPATVIGESIRAIGDPFFELYIGRNAANMVCLFAVQPADSFAMSCVTIDEFPSTGVRLEWSGQMSSIAADGTIGVVPSAMRAIWRPDGTLDLGGGPR